MIIPSTLFAAPLLEGRNKIVRGEVVPEGGEGDVRGIPDFWSQVFSSHEAFEDVVSAKDLDVLKSLSEVRVERSETTHEDKPCWAVKLIFVFTENDFFEQTELTKTYFFLDQDESIAQSSVGCTITWKDGAHSPTAT
jgi:nucleosome assembly protein 1-like 1